MLLLDEMAASVDDARLAALDAALLGRGGLRVVHLSRFPERIPRRAPGPAPRTKWTRRVPPPLQIGHAASRPPN